MKAEDALALSMKRGVPKGGTGGQVLTKKSSTDFDTEWKDPEGGGGGSLPIASAATLGAIKTGTTVETDVEGVCEVSIPFSTSEFYTGLKWIDGKKIYGKNYSLASIPTEYTKIDDLSGRNLIFAFGSVAYSSKRWVVPFHYNNSVYCTICTTDTEIQVRGTQYTTNLVVTVYYTKGE